MNQITLETEHGRETYRRIMAEYSYGDLRRMIQRLDALLIKYGAEGDDFESRVASAAGHMKSIKEMRNEYYNH